MSETKWTKGPRGGTGMSKELQVALWLMKIDERPGAYCLSSDDAEAWVSKRHCRQLPNGQWEMPASIAVSLCLERGAT